jgi:glutamine amidotransferase
MCRLAAWTGRPLPLSALTHDPPHSLEQQSHRPRHMREAALNADGWGAAWYPDDGDPAPVRYRVATPAWSDENLRALAPRTRARTMLASVRAATPGMPFSPLANQPFVRGRVAFVHNGYLMPFAKIRRPLRERLGEEAELMLQAGLDSEHLFALLWQELGGDDSVKSIHRAVKGIARTGRELALAAGGRAYLNFIVTNGEALVATRLGTEGGGGSLFVARGARGYEGGVAIASEPLTEDAAWLPVDDGVIMVARPDGALDVEPLGPWA